MKLTTEKFEIETNTMGQLSSVKFEGTELLHDGKQWWGKTFPIIWPVVSVSEDFVVNGKSYDIPKHGFMKDLEWEEYKTTNEISMVSTFMANDVYPFTMDISTKIRVEGNTVFIDTQFANLSKEDAYFHFGFHPAFKIDADSILKTDSALAIGLDGKLTDKVIKQENLMDMAFGKEYDTLVDKQTKVREVEYKYGKNDISILFNAPNVQYWKPADALFVCIEPWWGAGDAETTFKANAKDKDEIITLPYGKTWTASMAIKAK